MLSEDAKAFYRREGYYFPLTAMPRNEATRYRGALEDWEQRNATGLPSEKLLRSKAHLMSTALFELVHRESVLDAVEDILRPDILRWASGVFLKEAGDPAFIAWHQDGMYWGLDRPDIGVGPWGRT